MEKGVGDGGTRRVERESVRGRKRDRCNTDAFYTRMARIRKQINHQK